MEMKFTTVLPTTMHYFNNLLWGLTLWPQSIITKEYENFI